LTGQIPDAKPPVVVNDEEYEVDEIKDSRIYYKKLQ
jgi:hypothetical protein